MDPVESYVSEDAVILDLGCGTGVFSQGLAIKSNNILALDINVDVLKINQASPAVHRICADAQNIPIQNGTIDVVLCISSLEHIPNVYLAIDEINRILQNDGLLIVQLPNPHWFIEPHTKFPLLFVLNDDLKSIIANQFGYGFINFRLTLKNLQKITKTYFLTFNRINLSHGIRIPFWPPAWLIFLKKSKALEE
jgi:ubiquinone/menaquinone biosynthesis C-methylase UbiE